MRMIIWSLLCSQDWETRIIGTTLNGERIYIPDFQTQLQSIGLSRKTFDSGGVEYETCSAELQQSVTTTLFGRSCNEKTFPFE
jgi:hypothetical protein